MEDYFSNPFNNNDGENNTPDNNTDANSFYQSNDSAQNSGAGSYYQPQQANGFGNYYTQNQTPYSYAPYQPPKKKKNKTLITIIIIIALCVIIAIAGIATAISSGIGNLGNNSGSNPFSQSDEGDFDDNDTVNGDVEAEVEGSESNPETDKDGNYTAVGVAKNAKASCVGITVYTDESDYYNFYGNQNSNSSNKQASGEGSGVIMAEKNGLTYIMTCAHVIADGSSFTVTLDNDKEYDAKMVGYDHQTDIGVLAIKATGLQVAKFGDSGDIEVGQNCVAIGCPGGLAFKNSVSEGIVSALAVPIESQIGYKNECIQTTAAINPGNSGGALFNMQGQVIGINSSKIASTEYEGMGFAVPSNTAVSTAKALIKDGYVAGRARIGIEYAAISNYENAQQLLETLAIKGYKDAEGAMVIQVIDDESNLKNKDVQQYDMIVAVDGETLTSTDVMTSKLSDSKPGDTITLTIARFNNNSVKIFDVKCKLIESEH